jgi:hypothetical protein
MADYYGHIPTADDMIIERHQRLNDRVSGAEGDLGRTLTQWQREVALAYLTISDFFSSGKGAGKSFLLEFMRDSELIEEIGGG